MYVHSDQDAKCERNKAEVNSFPSSYRQKRVACLFLPKDDEDGVLDRRSFARPRESCFNHNQ